MDTWKAYPHSGKSRHTEPPFQQVEMGRRLLDSSRPATRRLLADSGISIVEVLAASLVLGIAVVGIATMFGRGSAFVAGSGDDRVAAALAQEQIERLRAAPWDSVVQGWNPEEIVRPAGVVDARVRAFRRQTCIQYVDASTPEGLNTPPYDPTCTDGSPSSTRRITVIVSPIANDGSANPESNGVSLQGWITQSGL